MSSGRTTAAESRPDESIVVHESTNSKLTHGGAGPRKQERPGAVYARRGAMQDLVEVRTHKKVFSDVRSLVLLSLSKIIIEQQHTPVVSNRIERAR